MKIIRGVALFTVFLAAGAAAEHPALTVPLTVTQGTSVRTLHFGLAPAATDGQDLFLGELELPPAPPAGALDARFVPLEGGLQGLAFDYRAGMPRSAADAVFRIRLQRGAEGAPVVLGYDLPPGVHGRLVDPYGGALVNHAMSGRNIFVLERDAVNELAMEISWQGAEEGGRSLPAVTALGRNYPNPFNPSTTFHFTLSVTGPVSLKIYDVVGREVAALVDGALEAGAHSAVWNADGAAGGVYFARLTAGGVTDTRSALLLK